MSCPCQNAATPGSTCRDLRCLLRFWQNEPKVVSAFPESWHSASATLSPLANPDLNKVGATTSVHAAQVYYRSDHKRPYANTQKNTAANNRDRPRIKSTICPRSRLVVSDCGDLHGSLNVWE